MTTPIRHLQQKGVEIFDTVPMPTGSPRIGMVRYDLEDPYRKDLKFQNGRLVPIQIYFPMEKGL